MQKSLLKLLRFIGTALAAVACGSWLPFGYGCALYGVNPPSEHPTIRLTDFSYTPASAVHIGDTLTLTATTNLPSAEAEVRVELPSETFIWVPLADDGQPPDQAAGDGIWTGEKTWTAEMGPVDDGYMTLVLGFFGQYASQALTERLTVLPEED